MAPLHAQMQEQHRINASAGCGADTPLLKSTSQPGPAPLHTHHQPKVLPSLGGARTRAEGGAAPRMPPCTCAGLAKGAWGRVLNTNWPEPAKQRCRGGPCRGDPSFCPGTFPRPAGTFLRTAGTSPRPAGTFPPSADTSSTGTALLRPELIPERRVWDHLRPELRLKQRPEARAPPALRARASPARCSSRDLGRSRATGQCLKAPGTRGSWIPRLLGRAGCADGRARRIPPI
eukprot:gene15360-biopygen2159